MSRMLARVRQLETANNASRQPESVTFVTEYLDRDNRVAETVTQTFHFKSGRHTHEPPTCKKD